MRCLSRKGFDIGYDRFIELYHTVPEKACICELAEGSDDPEIRTRSITSTRISRDVGVDGNIPSVDESWIIPKTVIQQNQLLIRNWADS